VRRCERVTSEMCTANTEIRIKSCERVGILSQYRA